MERPSNCVPVIAAQLIAADRLPRKTPTVRILIKALGAHPRSAFSAPDFATPVTVGAISRIPRSCAAPAKT